MTLSHFVLFSALASTFSVFEHQVESFQIQPVARAHIPFKEESVASDDQFTKASFDSGLHVAASSTIDLGHLELFKTRVREDVMNQQALLDEIQVAKAELEKANFVAGQAISPFQTGENTSKITETTARSIVKSMMWRVIAGSVTLFTSLHFSGSLSTALSIVGSDFLSKAATMFIGERIMNKSQAGRKSGSDDVGRSLAKALIWRLFAICTTLTMSFAIVGNLSMASKIAGSDAVFKTSLMFFYERMWAKIEWGKEYVAFAV